MLALRPGGDGVDIDAGDVVLELGDEGVHPLSELKRVVGVHVLQPVVDGVLRAEREHLVLVLRVVAQGVAYSARVRLDLLLHVVKMQPDEVVVSKRDSFVQDA